MSELKPLVKYEDLRGYIDLLRQNGELKTVTTEVDPNQELGAIFLELARHQNRGRFYLKMSKAHHYQF